jgi:GAF domain-containing protein
MPFDFSLLSQEVEALIGSEPDEIANFSNISALLFHALNKELNGAVNWCGFYRVVPGQESLLLGPFQGQVACLRIPYSSGVCGAAAKNQKTLVVPDVEAFPGHIACDSASKSEIVIPVFNADKEMIAILDVDSSELNTFSAEIEKGLELCIAKFQRPTPQTPPSRKIKHAKH